MAYWSTIHETMKQAPTRVIFRHQIKLPCDLMLGIPAKEPLFVDNYADEISERLWNVHELVRNQIIKVSYRMKARYKHKGS